MKKGNLFGVKEQFNSAKVIPNSIILDGLKTLPKECCNLFNVLDSCINSKEFVKNLYIGDR